MASDNTVGRVMKRECHDLIVKCDECKKTLLCRLDTQQGLVVYVERCSCRAKDPVLFPGLPKVARVVVDAAKRDQDLTDVYDTFRALFAPRALDETFWGENKVAKAYRAEAAEVVKAFGKDHVCYSICGQKANAWWVNGGRSFSLGNALRKGNIEIGKSYWDKMSLERQKSLVAAVNEYQEGKRCR